MNTQFQISQEYAAQLNGLSREELFTRLNTIHAERRRIESSDQFQHLRFLQKVSGFAAICLGALGFSLYQCAGSLSMRYRVCEISSLSIGYNWQKTCGGVLFALSILALILTLLWTMTLEKMLHSCGFAQELVEREIARRVPPV